MVSQLYGRKQLKGRVAPDDSDSNDDKGDPDEEKQDNEIKDGKDQLNLNKVNIFKTNLIRFAPAKLTSRTWLKEEEQLFLNGFDKYYERINLVNFFREIDRMKTELETLKKEHKKKVVTESGSGGIYKIDQDSDAKLDSKRSRKKKKLTKRPPSSSSSESSSSVDEQPKV